MQCNFDKMVYKMNTYRFKPLLFFRQNTDLAVPKIAADSGGKSYFADDDNPEISLQQAMVDTSNQGCSEKAIVSNKYP